MWYNLSASIPPATSILNLYSENVLERPQWIFLVFLERHSEGGHKRQVALSLEIPFVITTKCSDHMPLKQRVASHYRGLSRQVWLYMYAPPSQPNYWRILAWTARVNQVIYDQFAGWFCLMPGGQNKDKLVIHTPDLLELGVLKFHSIMTLHSCGLLSVFLKFSYHIWQC